MSAAPRDDRAGRAPWKDLRAELEARGFRPSRRFGQNFLLDENMLRAIVRDARVGPGDRVLEIGVGLGFLTRHLLAAGALVVGVEIDPRLFDLATEQLGMGTEQLGIGTEQLGAPPALTLLRADVLASKHALAPEVLEHLPAAGPWQVVANLPYSITGPVLCALSDLPNPPRALTVLVQKEVAQRIVAGAGDPERGPLSLHLQLDHEARLVRDVAAALFWPRPKVESTVVRLERRALAREPAPPGQEAGTTAQVDAARADAAVRAGAENRARPVAPEAGLDARTRRRVLALVHVLFQHRRQTVSRVLAGFAGSRPVAEAALARAGIAPSSRVETLEIGRLVALAAALPEHVWKQEPG